MMYRTIFTIDGFVPAYLAYTNGDTWNGWDTPYFEVNEALQVMRDYNKDAESPMQYDEATDTFHVTETECTSEGNWKGRNIVTEDGIKHLYGIGSYSWVWDAVNDNDRRYMAQQVEEFMFYHDAYKHMDEYDHRRDATVESIIDKFGDLNTFHKAICIMRDEDLEAEARFETLKEVLA